MDKLGDSITILLICISNYVSESMKPVVLLFTKEKLGSAQLHLVPENNQ